MAFFLGNTRSFHRVQLFSSKSVVCLAITCQYKRDFGTSKANDYSGSNRSNRKKAFQYGSKYQDKAYSISDPSSAPSFSPRKPSSEEYGRDRSDGDRPRDHFLSSARPVGGRAREIFASANRANSDCSRERSSSPTYRPSNRPKSSDSSDLPARFNHAGHSDRMDLQEGRLSSLDRPREHFGNFDRSRDNRSDRYNSRPPSYPYRTDNELRAPPAYGYYDGDHIYGINPVRLALLAKRRKVSELLVQVDMDISNKKDGKAAQDILILAKSQGIGIKELSKHDLNMLAENRPHQGFILRASARDFIDIDELEYATNHKTVLVLDEVWDPQNFGALLRTAHYLRADKVVVCAKNSAPLSPVVSKASAGAMESMDIYSTSNLMKFLDKSKVNHWQVIGTQLGERSVSLSTVPLIKPTMLILGNEGHGIRTNILNRCDHLVKIDCGLPAVAGAGEGYSGEMDVDSLNVSVTGGILLHYLLTASK